MKKNAFNLAMEELETPPASPPKQDNIEHEVTLYAEIGDFEGLENCVDKEKHEQWEIKPEGEANKRGRFRVRKTTSKEGVVSYTQTIKITGDKGTVIRATELEMSITEEVFEAFKAISSKGMIKTRYKFATKNIIITRNDTSEVIEVPEMLWEVDVYPSRDVDVVEGSGYSPWCKIDLEIHPLINKVTELGINEDDIKLKLNVKELPFKPTKVVSNTPENKDFVSKLYDDYFLTKLA